MPERYSTGPNPIVVLLRAKNTRPVWFFVTLAMLALQMFAAMTLPDGHFGPTPWWAVMLPVLLWIASDVFCVVLAAHQIFVMKTIPWIVYGTAMVCTLGTVISIRLVNSYLAVA